MHFTILREMAQKKREREREKKKPICTRQALFCRTQDKANSLLKLYNLLPHIL